MIKHKIFMLIFYEGISSSFLISLVYAFWNQKTNINDIIKNKFYKTFLYENFVEKMKKNPYIIINNARLDLIVDIRRPFHMHSNPPKLFLNLRDYQVTSVMRNLWCLNENYFSDTFHLRLINDFTENTLEILNRKLFN